MTRPSGGRRTAVPLATDEGERRHDSRRAEPFPIVGIGASAGGLEAFSALLKQLPLDTGMGFVLVQHLDPEHDSALTQLLGRATSLPVHEVTNNLRVEPNHVYVIPPNRNLSIAAGVLTLGPRPRTRTPHRSIDFFLEALARDQRECAIGVVLSGTATDGTLGLEAIKAEGGLTFAQDESARYDSMPRSAVAAGTVDFVLSPEHIAAELARIAKHPSVRSVGSGALPPADDFTKILLLLRNYSSVDFSLYKSSTIERRITRRMVLTKHDTLERYAQFLRGNSDELGALYSDVLISVTSFFRNPDAFELLRRKVWPPLLRQHGADPLRAWVLGCSTGQEAYSIAMSFVEAADQLHRVRQLQVFATDLNDALLEKARHGLYARNVAQELSPERLRRFFVEEEGGFRVSKALREMVVFARHNVISDPPFSRLDLISCRNLLIYFEPALQKKIFPIFHYALKPGGFLYLGASESIGGFTELFEPLDKKQKIYTKKASPTPSLRLPARTDRDQVADRSQRTPEPLRRHPTPGGPAEDVGDALGAQREADRVAVKQFAPPAVLINSALQILQFRGPTAAYLEPPTGKATFDVLKMARTGLMIPLRSTINKAKKENAAARKEHVRLEENGTPRPVNIEVIPLKNLRDRCFLVVFEDGGTAEASSATARSTGRPPPHPPPRAALRASEARRTAALEAELSETRDYLQSIHEQHEAATEKLQASSEEVQSANEELQSINEELETSKEELESANEELITLNEEMVNRNAELTRLTSDMVNIQTSAHLAIVLLGRELKIRRFSVPASKQLNLLPSDIGRPLSQVRHNLEVPDLEPFIMEVIDDVRARERDVKDKDGRWFSLRVRPYLTADNKVDGAVVVVVDINDLKLSELAIAAARDYAENILGTVREPLIVLGPGLRVESVNLAFYRTFGVTPADTIGKFIYDLGHRQWDIPELRRLLDEVLTESQIVEDFLVECEFERLGRRTMLLNARHMHSQAGVQARIVLAIEDITARKQTEERLRDSEQRFTRFMQHLPGLAWIKDSDGRYVYANDAAETAFRTARAELYGKTDRELFPQGTAAQFEANDRQAVDQSSVQAVEAREDETGVVRQSIVSKFSIPGANGDAVLIGGLAIDITDLKRAEEALRESDRRKSEFLAMLAHELRNPLAPISVSIELLRRANRLKGADLHALEVLQRQVGQMVRLVDDLLDAGRISRGKIDLRRERVELASVVYHVVEAVRPISEHRAQELTVTLPGKPVYLDADPTRLAQIVGNLLNNACKFTERGGHIWLTATSEDNVGAGHGGMVREVVIRVRDTGIGIADDQLERVFDMFTQVDRSLERSMSGLGIGLTLVKTLTEMHGGTVEARSDGTGRGSEFVVRLPVAIDTDTSECQSPKPLAVPSAPLRILVVDDNRDAVDVLALLLKLAGHQTFTAHDGVVALEEAARLDPDVILLDLGLPGLNGYDVARRVREFHDQTRRPLLVALTGWGQDEDRHRSAEAGFDAHLVKPLDVAALHTLLAEFAGRNERPAR